MNYTELCDGCLLNNGNDKEVCAQCQGKGISLGQCTGKEFGKLSAIERTASLLLNMSDKQGCNNKY